MTYPWEQTHELTLAQVAEIHAPAPMPVETVVQALQADMRYALANTAVMVHSEHEALQLLVNTRRGQIIPRGECWFTDGTKFELQDIGMPQVGAPEMTVPELVTKLWELVGQLGLELRK